MSWRRFCKTSWRRLEDVWPRRIYWSWSRRLEDVLKTSSEDEDQRRLQDVFIKTNVCWDMASQWRSKSIISNTFISNTSLKLAENQAIVKQHTEPDLLRFENYSYMPTSKNNKTFLKNKQVSKFVCIHEIIRLNIMKLKMNMKKKENRYDINRPRSRHWRKHSKYKKCLSMMILI